MSRKINVNKIRLTEEQESAKTGGKLLFTKYKEQSAALYLLDNRLIAAQFFPREQSRIGGIYIAKVKNVVQNLNACFVEIGTKERECCFLSKKDSAYPILLNRQWDGRILEGDEFPVQIVRDAQKNKQASVTTMLSLSNSYFALSVGSTHTGFSGKLSPESKSRLKAILKETGQMTPAPVVLSGNGMNGGSDSEKHNITVPLGLIVRTQAGALLEKTSPEGTRQILTEALEDLTYRFSDVLKAAPYRTCFSCLLEPPAYWEEALNHLVSPGEYEEILTDDEELYEQLRKSSQIPEDKNIRLYDSDAQQELPLSKLYGLESKLENALGRRVWLKSGGYLVIDPTEALTVIDVNSGKFESGKAAEETYFQINLEAAREIALQLRLRNLSGIIVVDFINMKSKEYQEELMNCLSRLLERDRQKAAVVDMTALGLVEITRKKIDKPLAEQLN